MRALVQYLIKLVLTATVIVAATEAAKRNVILGAIIGSLPLVSLLAVTWLWRETGDTAKVAGYLSSTLWLVIASLPLFIVTPALLRAGWTFWPAIGVGGLSALAGYGVMIWVLSKQGAQAS